LGQHYASLGFVRTVYRSMARTSRADKLSTITGLIPSLETTPMAVPFLLANVPAYGGPVLPPPEYDHPYAGQLFETTNRGDIGGLR
jgi:hypothetical protein